MWGMEREVSAILLGAIQAESYPAVVVDWQNIEAFALSLEGVSSSVSYGEPSLKIGKCLVARHRVADNSIVLKSVDCDERDALIAANPDVYFVEDHYLGYDIVLARLD